MADLDLRVDYQDDILDSSVNTKRKYNIIENADGTKSLEDVSVYTQKGDSFGAVDVNKTNQAVLDLNSSLNTIDYDNKISFTSEFNSNLNITIPSNGIVNIWYESSSDGTSEVGITSDKRNNEYIYIESKPPGQYRGTGEFFVNKGEVLTLVYKTNVNGNIRCTFYPFK